MNKKEENLSEDRVKELEEQLAQAHSHINDLTQRVGQRDMKIASLIERISDIVKDYENSVADLRVAYTQLSRAQEQSVQAE